MTRRLALAIVTAGTLLLAAAPAHADAGPGCGVYTTSQLLAACQTSDSSSHSAHLAERLQLEVQQDQSNMGRVRSAADDALNRAKQEAAIRPGRAANPGQRP